MSSILSEYISEQAVLRDLSWSLLLKIVRIYSFTDALKTRVLLFQKFFKLNKGSK